jgi:hypothetical protein
VVEREIGAGWRRAQSAVVYKILSWDAHAVVGPIRDVSVGVRGDRVTSRFGRREDESDIERHAWMSGGVLFYIYNDFARMWGLPAVVPPNAAT